MLRRTYYRILDDDVPEDAVAVSIGGATLDEMTVSIVWPSKGLLFADEEAAADVWSALQTADQLRLAHGFERVVIWIENADLWNPSWGMLMEISPEPAWRLV